MRYDLVCDPARSLLAFTRLRPPVDVDAIIDLALPSGFLEGALEVA